MSESIATRVKAIPKVRLDGEPPPRKRDATLLWPGLVTLIAVLYPLMIGHNAYWLFVGTQVATYVLIASGLNLLLGYAGEAFLGQGALIAVGGYATGLLMVNHGWSFWCASLASIPMVVVFGVIVALPSLRISSWYFALITLSLDTLVQSLLRQFNWTGGATGVLGISMPSVMGTPMTGREFYWMVLFINAVAAYVLWRLVRSRYGRALTALRDGGAAANSVGASPLRIRLMAFIIAAIVSSIGGSLYASLSQVITPDNFDVTFSLFFLVAVVVGGTGRLWGPVVGCVVFFTVPDLLHFLKNWQLLVYGVALLVLMLFAPRGLVGALRDGWAWLRANRPDAPSASKRPPLGVDVGHAAREMETLEKATAQEGAALELTDVSMAFGAVRALDELSLSVPPSSVFAIVGPNGSGKTTALNAITGYYRPQTGRVSLDGREVVGLHPAAIARMGVARTFQTPKVLPELTVLDNVLLGTYHREAATFAEVVLGVGRARAERDRLTHEATTLLELSGVGGTGDLPGGAVSHGQQRLVELARAMMSRARLVLLDEPAAGLGPDDIAALSRTIEVMRAGGATIVIVEHHVDLVSDIADVAAVIDRGRLLAVGPPADVFTRPEVTSAYMGTGGRS